MATRLTVFYSWQSDTPSNLNRNFIEKALREALKRLRSEATLENALRDTTVELDKDIQGVAGSPPIAETILRKIEECAVFAADLSFVGALKGEFTNASESPRQFPNPNVLIEYGYALRCHSHVKLIGIMNTAYGKPDAQSLPFDLRHLLWPICYHLTDPSAADKSGQFEGLVKTLVKAIGLILSKHPPPNTLLQEFAPRKPTKNPAIFFDTPGELLGDSADTFSVPDGGKAYLRLYPSYAVPSIDSELEARNLATKGLQPLGEVSGWGFDRNIFGAIAYERPSDRELYHFTQLFLSREIWGVDARVLNADYISNRMQQYGQGHVPSKHIASGYIETHFIKALQSYLTFAQAHLKLTTPLQIEAGLVGIKGYSIAVWDGRLTGKALRDDISVLAKVESFEEPAWETLAPFFDRIWANCGIGRTAQDQDRLANRYLKASLS